MLSEIEDIFMNKGITVLEKCYKIVQGNILVRVPTAVIKKKKKTQNMDDQKKSGETETRKKLFI